MKVDGKAFVILGADGYQVAVKGVDGRFYSDKTVFQSPGDAQEEAQKVSPRICLEAGWTEFQPGR